MQKITPCLWFDTQAEEAAKFYCSIFKDSELGHITRYDAPSAEVSGMPEGSILTVEFKLDGQDFLGLNGGPAFKFTEAISFQILCEDQDEIDHYWYSLSEGGEESQCGWLKDHFGVSWQVTPKLLHMLLKDNNKDKSQKAMQAMLKMQKLDIAALQEAFDSV